MVKDSIDFQLISKGFGRECDWFVKDLVRNSTDFNENLKGFGKDFNWFPIDF